jgi:hypothetical protein
MGGGIGCSERPLMRPVSRRIVWGVYEDGRLTKSFRDAGDGTTRDAHDEPCVIAADAQVGLVHPVELDAETSEAWVQCFADYEVLQPFVQLGRPAFVLTDAERSTDLLNRGCGGSVLTGRLLGLTRQGWRRGSVEDGGSIMEMTRDLGSCKIVLSLADPKYFHGESAPTVHGVRADRTTWGALPASVGSEVLWMLEQLHAP